MVCAKSLSLLCQKRTQLAYIEILHEKRLVPQQSYVLMTAFDKIYVRKIHCLKRTSLSSDSVPLVGTRRILADTSGAGGSEAEKHVIAKHDNNQRRRTPRIIAPFEIRGHYAKIGMWQKWFG